jgi:phage shock protein B
MKTLVYILGGIGLGVFGVHVYNDAGRIPMAPTPMVAESRIVVTPEGWLAEPVAPASLSIESANRPVVKPPEPALYSAESSSRPAVKPPEPASRVAEVVGPVVAPPRANHYASTSWGQPAQVQVNGPGIVAPFTGLILFAGMLAILFIVIRSARRGRVAAPSDESALVHELARRAQDLSQRMEALETILLDRTRTAR